MDQAFKQYQECLRGGKVNAALTALNELVQTLVLSEEELTARLCEATLECYRELHFKPVHQLFQALPAKVPPPLSTDLQEALDPHIKETMRWAKQLQGLSTERRSNELRNAVRDKSHQQGLALMKAFMEEAKSDAERNRVASMLGGVLGTLINDAENVQVLIKHLARNLDACEYTPRHLNLIEEGVERRKAGLYKEGTANLERSLKVTQTALVMELRGQLPGVMTVGTQVTEKHVDKFRNALRALVGSALAAGQADRWSDLLQVLIELCPQTLSATGAQAGVEVRLYTAVSPIERRIIDKCMFELSQLPQVPRKFLEFADTLDAKQVRQQCNAIEIMGVIRSDVFLRFIIERMDQLPEARPVGIEALGSIGSGPAADRLIRLLDAALRRGVKRGLLVEGSQRRQALSAITALGRIASSRRSDAKTRNAIFERTRRRMPAGDGRVRMHLILSFFTRPAAEWSERNLQWAIETLTSCLWLADDTPAFAAGEERQRTQLGFREPIVDVLGRIGKHDAPRLISVMERHLGEPGGGFMGCAHVLREVGDPAGLPLLEKMVKAVTTSSKTGKYDREAYYDATTEKRETLTADHIVSDLIFAMSEIGGEAADEAMSRLFEAFKAGRLRSPGKQTLQVLLDARQRWSRRTGREVFAVEEKEIDLQRQLGAEEKELLLKNLKAGLLMTAAKKNRMIASIQQLGEYYVEAAIDPLLDLVAHKDHTIRAAAATALDNFVDTEAPPALAKALCMSLVERLDSPKVAEVEAAKKLLIDLRPDREPFQSTLAKISQTDPDGRLAMIIEDVLERAGMLVYEKSLAKEEAAETEQARELAEAAPAGAAAVAPQPARAVDLVALKREYFQARQSWIVGGKKGPAPEAPPELG